MPSRLTALCALFLAACTFPEYDVATSLAVGGSSNGGTAANAGGSAAAGSGGSATAPACEPAETDTHCDGLDESCNRTSSDSGCPQNCKPELHGDKTYMRCLPPPSLTFDQAEAKCELHGMHLAVIDDAAENEYLIQPKRQMDPYIWLGGTSTTENVFHWVTGPVFYDNGPVEGVYQNFSAGGPDTNDATLDCVQFETTGLWSAAHCSDTQAYICEL